MNYGEFSHFLIALFIFKWFDMTHERIFWLLFVVFLLLVTETLTTTSIICVDFIRISLWINIISMQDFLLCRFKQMTSIRLKLREKKTPSISKRPQNLNCRLFHGIIWSHFKNHYHFFPFRPHCQPNRTVMLKSGRGIQFQRFFGNLFPILYLSHIL